MKREFTESGRCTFESCHAHKFCKRQMAFYLVTSPARREFKKMLGQGNHLLITAIVGLDAIERGIVTRAPEEFPAKWAPQDRFSSARRSRNLILEMALVRSVDALDIYISRTNRKPFLIEKFQIKPELDRAGRSIRGKFGVIERNYPLEDKVLSALVAILIGWRNKAVHSEDEDELEEKYVAILKCKSDEISDRFHGLETGILLKGYKKNRSPHLKEVTSFINATHQYVRAVDRKLLIQLASEQYLRELIWVGIREEASVRDADGRVRIDKSKIKPLLENKWGTGLSLKRRKQAVEGFLRHLGLSSQRPPADEPHVIFDDGLLEELVSRTPAKVYQWAASGTMEN